MADEAKSLSEEIVSGKPRKKYLNLSLGGIAEAVEKIGAIAVPILTTVNSIAAFVAKL